VKTIGMYDWEVSRRLAPGGRAVVPGAVRMHQDWAFSNEEKRVGVGVEPFVLVQRHEL